MGSTKTCFNYNAIRAERQKWTLGSDVDLLNRLESFSQGLVDRTCCLLRNIEDFEKDIKITRLEVKTLSNTFEAVSDTQFVESRVYDEEEDVVSYQKDKVKNPSIDINLNEKLEEALKTCSNILESKFEAVRIPLSDSDDEDEGNNKVNSEVIFIPKNKYKARPLPHLIGGEEFNNDDSLGLYIAHNTSETLNDKMLNGEDESSSHSEISSIDEPDESSVAPDFGESKLFDNEIASLSDSKENSELFFGNKEAERKNQPSPSLKKSFSNTKIEKQSSSEIAERNSSPEKTETYSSPEKVDFHSSPEKTESYTSSEKTHTAQNSLSLGVNARSSIHEELKQRFSSKNNKGSLPEFKTSNIKSGDIDSSSQRVITDSLVKPEIVKQSVSQSEDNLLPNVETEILHSFSKERAKIKGKRRLPSRKSRIIECDTNESTNVKVEKKENPILSPSTDEEDIFVVPQTQLVKESPASSLFMKSSIFSPGLSIEEDSNKLFPEEIRTESNNEIDNSYFEEPLGIHKSNVVESKDSRNRNLFNDWDPFDSDESALFPSIKKRPNKTKLFDDLDENLECPSKNMVEDDDDDLFSNKTFPSSSANIFENKSKITPSQSEGFSFSKSEIKTKGPLKLFSDASDDENEKEDDIFSSDSTYKSPFLVTLDRRKNDSANNKKNELDNNEEGVISRRIYSNSLSDSEDNFFD